MARNSRRAPPEDSATPLIRVQRATRTGRAPAPALFARWACAAGAPPGVALTVRLVGSRESRRLNAAFRGKDAATNVLAFPAGPVSGADEPELGDLVICLPVVAGEARAQGKRLHDHLAHLVVHGTLHLLGHDHDRPANARKMEVAELRILQGLGIADPYRVRRPAPGRARQHRQT